MQPVLTRGPNTWTYNPRNPYGLALILLTVAFVVGVLFWHHDDTNWSEAELRGATHQAASSLEGKPQLHNGWVTYAMLIKEAVDHTGKGPSYGARVDREGDSDDYTVTGEGTDAAFCLHLSATPAHGSYVTLSIKIADGPCRGAHAPRAAPPARAGSAALA